MRTWSVPILASLLTAILPLASAQSEPTTRAAAPIDAKQLDTLVGQLLAEHDAGIEASLWLGGIGAKPHYARHPEVARPCASSIKTAYLIELFAEYESTLDEPLPNASSVLDDPEHPAIRHFTGPVQAEIKNQLNPATVRRVGVAMIRGTGVSNAVYNAAANLTTAVLGGPEGLTARVHRRSDSFAGMTVRRYMLAARDVTGDNEVTAESLAAALRMLAARKVPGVADETIAAMRKVMFLERDPKLGDHYFKSGSLDSDPLTRVLSGWYEKDGKATVYVVLAEQPGPGDLARPEAGGRLARTATRLRALLLAATGKDTGSPDKQRR